MKEIETLERLHTETRIELGVEKEQKKEIKLVASQRRIPGLVLWSFNQNTKELKKADFVTEDFTIDFTKHNPVEDLLKRSKVRIEENCLYFQALNRKNAIKKLEKAGIEIFKS